MKFFHSSYLFIGIITSSFLLTSCEDEKNIEPSGTNSASKKIVSDYWFSEQAEISSYQLTQSRYGQKRVGNALLLTTSENIDPKTGIHPEVATQYDEIVLKTQLLKKYTTGVQDHSVMTSCFTPFNNGPSTYTTKVACSIQEWAGQTYTQLNLNGKRYSVINRSYVEQQSELDYEIPAVFLLDEVFAIIRINPDLLPTGKFQAVPFIEQCRYKQITPDLKPFEALVNVLEDDGATEYILKSGNYIFKIVFQSEHPHQIESWTEFEIDNKGIPKTNSVTKAVRIKTIRTDSWNKTGNSFAAYRDSLGIQ